MTIVCSAATAGNSIALTFDDGPLIPYTEQILETFARYDARATFFVRGGALSTDSEAAVVKHAHASGHEVGNHTQNHRNLSTVTADTIASEITETHDRLADLLGTPPRLIRPPYGRGTAAVDNIAAKLGYRATVLWSVSPNDWASPAAEVIVQRVLEGECPPHEDVEEHCRCPAHVPLAGAVVLLHDGHAPEQAGESRFQTVKAVRTLLPSLKSRGLTLVTVSELLTAGEAP